MTDSSAHRLWGGRFAGSASAAFDALNRSVGVDFRLWPFELRVSAAWARALGGAGVLTGSELGTLLEALERVRIRLADGEAPIASDEDIHTVIDRMVAEEGGEVAAKLHTGRSRNDQVATSARLWAMDAASRLDAAVQGLELALTQAAEGLGSAIMPAYTHMQRAIPVLGAHWALSHMWPLERDRQRLATARDGAAVLPLGSGAIAGCAYPISRDSLREWLGFDSLSSNSIDAVGDRDFAADLLYACVMIATHLSRLGEDLIIYGSSEFGFVKFGDSFTSGSSMMPQKRNPDALELARGSAGRMLGDLTALLATIKGLPGGYNKDLQDDKRAIFGAVDTLLLVLPAVTGAIRECRFDTARMEAAVSSSMLATDLADYLVRKGATFREAHGAVGRVVRLAEERGVELNALSLSDFTNAHALFDRTVLDALSPRASIAWREVPGGTGPVAVAAQLAHAKAVLASGGGN